MPRENCGQLLAYGEDDFDRWKREAAEWMMENAAHLDVPIQWCSQTGNWTPMDKKSLRAAVKGEMGISRGSPWDLTSGEGGA